MEKSIMCIKDSAPVALSLERIDPPARRGGERVEATSGHLGPHLCRKLPSGLFESSYWM